MKASATPTPRPARPLQRPATWAAPDCVRGPDGRYYLFYNRGARPCLRGGGQRPAEGPFQYLTNVAFPDGTEPRTKLFDPGVLIDENGRVYLYTGFVPTPGSPWAPRGRTLQPWL